jgi:hypothetical protein
MRVLLESLRVLERQIYTKHWRIQNLGGCKNIGASKTLADAKTLVHGKILAPTETLAHRKN